MEKMKIADVRCGIKELRDSGISNLTTLLL
jgi:hypothetical protein